MKTLRIIAVVFFSLMVISYGFSQNTMQDAHKKLTDLHASIGKKHEELNSGKVKDFKKFATEMNALLDAASKQLIALEKKQTPKQKEAVQANIDAMKKNHASALSHFKTLKAEADKPKPDQNKLKESSKLLNSQIKEAEKQNQEMLKKAPAK